LKDRTHTKPHEFALNPTLAHPHPQNKGGKQKKLNEINDLDAKKSKESRKKILMNQRPAEGSGSGQ
jgi:hypothetical protein